MGVKGTPEGGRRRAPPTIAQLSGKIADKIHKRIQSVFCSPERTRIYETQMERFNAEIDRVIRALDTPPDIVEIDQRIKAVLTSFGPSLNAPPAVFRRPLHDALVSDFVAYFNTICTISEYDARPLKRTTANADTFAACMCVWLARGYPLSTASIVKPHPFFTDHVPPDIRFCEFDGMSCSSMSGFARHFLAACMGVGHSVRPGARFKFSDNTIGQLQRTIRTIQRRLEAEAVEETSGVRG